MRIRVKVCGITSYDDAAMALALGADALGFNFYPASPRYIAPSAAGEIIRRLPPLGTSVGVFVNVTDPAEVARTAREAGIRVLQLHGDEAVEYCRRLEGWTLIKALRIRGDRVPEDFEAYPVHAFLLDAADERLFGGTGRTFDWSVCRKLQQARPIILAGGLNPDNIARAIVEVRPYAVDVCSGVESAPGKKDEQKLSRFLYEVGNVTDDRSDAR